jgi:hypothetical protein
MFQASALLGGMDVVRKIENARTDSRDRPEQEVLIAAAGAGAFEGEVESALGKPNSWESKVYGK